MHVCVCVCVYIYIYIYIYIYTHTHVHKLLIYLLQLIHVSAMIMAILREVHYKGYTVGYDTTNECYNKVFINKIRMLQRTRRNTIGRRSTRVRTTFRAFPL